MMAAVGSPPPAPPPAAARPHPTYKEMITQALRQRGGCNRLAIATYIADHFSGLPASHDLLLSAHLRRLLSEGVLRMSGYYFVLASSSSGSDQQDPQIPAPEINTTSTPAPTVKRGRGRPRKYPRPDVPASSSQPPVKRGRGRPRKHRNVSSSAGSEVKLETDGHVPVMGVKRGRGRPRKNPQFLTTAQPGRLNMLAASIAAIASRREATVTDPAMPNGKRGRGRPRKSVVTMGAALGSSENAVVGADVAGTSPGQGCPPNYIMHAHSSIAAPAMPSLGKRKRGRPRKEKPSQPGSVLSGDDSATKRGRGRPRKENAPEVVPTEAGGAVVTEMTEGGDNVKDVSSAQERGTGSPRKENTPGVVPTEAGGAVATEMTEGGGKAEDVSSAQKRGRGRPRKASTLVVGPISSAQKRGRGRPRKESRVEGGPTEAGGAAATEMTEGGVKAKDVSSAQKRWLGTPGKENTAEVGPTEAVGSAVAEMTEGGVKAEGVSSAQKRWPGTPGKENTAEVGPTEAGGSVATEMTEGRGKAEGVVCSAQKRGHGRPRKEKPSGTAPADIGVSALVEKRGCGRPRKQKPSEMVGMSVETSDDRSPRIKKGCGRPTMERPSVVERREHAASTGIKRGRGRPRKDQFFGFVEAAGKLSRDLAKASPGEDEDLVSREKIQTEDVAFGDLIETRLADASCVLVSGENAGSAPVEAGSVVSSAQKRGRGRPRKEKPSGTAPAEIGVAALVDKRRRGRPRKEKPSGTAPAEIGIAALVEKRGRGEDEDLVSREKTQTENVAFGDLIETRLADASCVLVSGESAASAPVEAGSAIDSNLGPVNL